MIITKIEKLARQLYNVPDNMVVEQRQYDAAELIKPILDKMQERNIALMKSNTEISVRIQKAEDEHQLSMARLKSRACKCVSTVQDQMTLAYNRDIEIDRAKKTIGIICKEFQQKN